MSNKIMSKTEIEQCFAVFAQHLLNPKTELQYVNNYTLLIAVVLSAQSTDKGVNKATHSLFKEVDTPEKMVELGEEKLIDYIKTIGLYRSKAKNIIALSQDLMTKHDSQVPNNLDSLVALAGVGRKTANVILNTAFGELTMAVDTHIFRVSNRMGLAIGKNVVEVEKNLLKRIPKHYLLNAHHWLILHGRYICVARKPKCDVCNVKQFCKYNEKKL
jgi:endonuclease-3